MMTDHVLGRVIAWASARADVRALALVGSYARGNPSPGSDVDFVLLTSTPATFTHDVSWAAEALGDGATLTRAQPWGAIEECRFGLPSGLEVEFGIGSPSWAATDPVDDGTRRVIADGIRILFDPDGLLAALVAAYAPGGEAAG